ncbi:DoxX family protein [Micromonospora auratinigra]|uniref:DoxX-like family protein n=1 Tax=Micromonospora auratinigra TaxID=261654 RepID=A0A1A8Z4M8_9ACTN|nr:DoxX family protein [Micromonospora auratinigra]SBT38805.1 DoxX-like family protein [Micromonospora auratinigra]
MFISYLVVTLILAAVLTISAVLTATGNPAVRAQMTDVGVPRSWLPWLAACKLAGAVGLVLGSVIPLLGVLASIGVICYFIGAVWTHLRARNFALVPPVVLGLAAVAALLLRIWSA